MTGEKTEEVRLAEMALNLEYIKRDLELIRKNLDQNYVTRSDFLPVKNIVFGLVAIVLTSVVGGLLALIIK